VATQLDPALWREAERWLVQADEDLHAAQVLASLAPPAIRPAAFHCHQAAEKMAKAALIAIGTPPPRLHDIGELGRRVRPALPAIGEALERLSGLGSWYLAVRYPDIDVPIGPSHADVLAALAALHELRGLLAGPVALIR